MCSLVALEARHLLKVLAALALSERAGELLFRASSLARGGLLPIFCVPGLVEASLGAAFIFMGNACLLRWSSSYKDACHVGLGPVLTPV